MKCNICHKKSERIFQKKVLGKYNVGFYRCVDCGYIQTEKPYWLKEAYSDAITSLDIGLIGRNIQLSSVVEDLLYKYFETNSKYLDFAGGYGMFTRIMRDKGFNFYHQDKFCENLFAKHFALENLNNTERRFELVTSFEMIEHLEIPYQTLDTIFKMSNSFLFTTQLVPETDLENWWYFGFEHGQHISFYTTKALNILANHYKKKLYSDGFLHLITNKTDLSIFNSPSKIDKIKKVFKNRFYPMKKLESLTTSDFEYIRGLINNSKK